MRSQAFQNLVQTLRRLPGMGPRSAERLALHLLLEQPGRLEQLAEVLREAAGKVSPCPRCGNLSEDGQPCEICADPRRNRTQICVVERVPDLVSLEKSGAYQGVYHVLQGRLSPVKGVGPGQLNLAALAERIRAGDASEVILALANDMEGEATCHYIREHCLAGHGVKVTRIGFGLPSGGDLVYADAVTLRNALDARRAFD